MSEATRPRRGLGRRGWQLVAMLALLAAYLVLRQLAATPRAPALAPAAAARAPFPVDFTLPDLQGNLVRLADTRGRVVLLNFWATWCPPCRAEMPALEALHRDYQKRGLTILAISSDVEGEKAVAPFVRRYGLTFTVLLDPRNTLGERLQVRGLPTTYLLDKAGRIAAYEVGIRDWNGSKMRRFLEALLAEEAPLDGASDS
ncbi:MAG: hypothetical protein KatS3mg131_1391 [Candidatus Tectimicrobiota bacterium]|nr:MAG: hypothetical protein KatS3mg131_1391 [Candidatus Tectomicrobia bacterium]